jgi:predicted SnoaL-like aldol condensation-catalyzing enzyme
MSATGAQSVLAQNKALVLRWFKEVWNEARFETVAELFAPDGVIHDGPATFRGPQEFAGFYHGLRAQFSDFSIQPVVTLAEDDLVCVHWSADFRHTESGKPLHVSGTSVVRIANGQFVEGWQNWDSAGLEAQLRA